MNHAIRNARIVTPDEDFIGSVEIRDGRIQKIDRGDSQVGEDFEEDILLPGIIDIHTDNLEKHFFPRPNIDWSPISAAVTHDAACVSVGVTTVFDSLSIGSFNGSPARGKENLHNLTGGLLHARDVGMLKADHYLHWRCETSSDFLCEWLEDFAGHPMAAMFSLMDHTPGQRQYKNLDKYLQNWRDQGLDDRAITVRLEECRERQERNALGNARIVAATSRQFGAVLVSHDDETPEHVDQAADLGATVAEFPVTVEAAERSRARGMVVVMGGPNLIRGGSYSGNVPASTLIQEGLLEAFASDYVPRSLIECAFRLVDPDFGWSLSRAISTVTSATARAAGLQDRGEVALGKRADLLRVRRVHGMPVLRGVWVEGARVA